MLHKAEETGANAVVCDYDIIKDGVAYPSNAIESETDVIPKETLVYGLFAHITKTVSDFPKYRFNGGIRNFIFNRLICKEIRFDEELCYAEDALFKLQCLLNANALCVCRQKLYHCFERTGSLSRSGKDYSELSLLFSMKRVELMENSVYKNYAIETLVVNFINFFDGWISKRNYQQFFKQRNRLLEMMPQISKRKKTYRFSYRYRIFLASVFPHFYIVHFHICLFILRVKNLFRKVFCRLFLRKKHAK